MAVVVAGCDTPEAGVGPFAAFWLLKELGCCGVMGVEGVGVGGGSASDDGVAPALMFAVEPFFLGAYTHH